MNILAKLDGKDVRIVDIVPTQVVGEYLILFVDLELKKFLLTHKSFRKGFHIDNSEKVLAENASIISSGISGSSGTSGTSGISTDDTAIRNIISEEVECKFCGELPTWSERSDDTYPKLGFNTVLSRLEFYSPGEDRWYYLWMGEVTEPPPPSPVLFLDDFEAGWFTQVPFSSIFTEDFEAGWFTQVPFSSIFTEDFENGGW